MAVKSPVLQTVPGISNNTDTQIVTAKAQVTALNNSKTTQSQPATTKPSINSQVSSTVNTVATTKFNVAENTNTNRNSGTVSTSKPITISQQRTTEALNAIAKFNVPTDTNNNTDTNVPTVSKFNVSQPTNSTNNNQAIAVTKSVVNGVTSTTSQDNTVNASASTLEDPNILTQVENQLNSNNYVVGTIQPIVTSQNQTIYPLATQDIIGNAVTITQSPFNNAGDIVTVYNTSKSISVTSIEQTVNDYTQLDTGVSQILAGEGVIVSSSSGNGLGIVTISATSGGTGNGSAIANGTSNVQVLLDGPIIIGVDGSSNVAIFTQDQLIISGDVIATNFTSSTQILRNNRNVPTFVYQSNVAPDNPLVGDQWYDTNTGTLFEYLDDGVTAAWLDMNGNPGVVSSNVNINTTVIDTPYVEVGTTNTLIDSFDAGVYRCAKYIMSSTNPYDSQVSEVLVLQNNGVSILNTYGSLNTGANTVSFFTNTSGSNVRLYAIGSTSNNQIRIEKTYFLL